MKGNLAAVVLNREMGNARAIAHNECPKIANADLRECGLWEFLKFNLVADIIGQLQPARPVVIA